MMEDNSQIIETVVAGEKKLELNEEALNELTQIRKWAMFFSVLGFIFIALMVFAGLIMAALSSGLAGAGLGKLPMVFVGILYLALGIIYILPVIYLYRFSVDAKIAIESKDAILIASALKSLKKHFRFIGVFTIVIFSIYVLAIIGFAIGRMIG
ncbi:MAG TPA: hypothetical protein PK252_02405 [Bacteroidales bacterium]|nr:hypothetical protein [Bacteroidales bacterium]